MDVFFVTIWQSGIKNMAPLGEHPLCFLLSPVATPETSSRLWLKLFFVQALVRCSFLRAVAPSENNDVPHLHGHKSYGGISVFHPERAWVH